MILNNPKQSSAEAISSAPSILRSPFLWKLYIGYSTLIITSACVMGSVIARRIEQNTLADIENSLHTNAILLSEIAAPSLKNNNSINDALQKRVHLTGREIKTRLTVIRTDGIVIADSEKKPESMDNHSSRPEILYAGSHGVGTATRYSQTTNSSRMYMAISVVNDDLTIGFARTSLPLSVIDQRINDLRWIVVLGTSLTTVVALFFGFLLARHMVGPLVSMTSVAERMAEGLYGNKITITRKDEIGQLANAFNLLAEKSQERMEMLTTDTNKLSVILGGMVEGVIAVNQDERVLHLNDAAGKLLQVSVSEALEKPIWEVTRIREIVDILSDALSGDAEVQRKYELNISSGKRSIEMHASGLHDGQGKLVGAVVVLHDVTKLIQVETIRRDFVANASHELKTPITAIRMLVETLLDDPTIDSQKQEEFLNRMRNQSLRLSSIVTDLLTLSRLESNKDELETVPLDLRKIIQFSATSSSTLAEKNGITIELDLPSFSVEISGDKESLDQVINNLLDNALKYTPSGGSVLISLKESDGTAVLEVQDTGLGIDSQDQIRIFERFYQVDKARSRDVGGTGLGLSIVKHIILSYSGTITVESTLGSGSTFRVTLPSHKNCKS